MQKQKQVSDLYSNDKETDIIPAIEHERITYIKEMENYLHKRKEIPKEQVKKCRKKI